jgi:hypothetical protein
VGRVRRHTRLSFLAKRIEAELRQAYDDSTPLAARRIRLAARYQALAESTLASIGRDAKASRRSVTALQAAADRQLSALEAHGHGRAQKPLDLARAIAAAQNPGRA